MGSPAVTFFGWLMALATACINVALGVYVWSLLSAVMSRTVTLHA